MSNKDKAPQSSNPPTVGEKSREAQPYGQRTTAGSQHNYQTSNATEPQQLAELAEEQAKKKAESNKPGPEGDDYRQHDTGG